MSESVVELDQASGADRDRFLQAAEHLVADGRWAEVGDLAETFINGTGGSADSFFLLALSAFMDEDFASALDFGQTAFDLNADAAEVAGFLSTTFALVGNIHQASFFAKMASALPPDARLRAWIPDAVPDFANAFAEIRERPLLQRAAVAAGQNRMLDAEHWFRQHLQVDPASRDAYLGLAHCLMSQERFQEAVENLRAGRHTLPGDAEIASQLGAGLGALGRFAESRGCHRAAMAAAPDDPVIHARAAQDLMLDPDVPARDLPPVFRAWGARFGSTVSLGPERARDPGKERLTLAYLVGGVGGRPGASALAATLARHDPQRFRVFGFGFGALTDAQNIEFQKCFEGWQDVRDVDPITFGTMVGAEQVDILVDLSGFRAPSLLTAFGARMAPVQVSWGGGKAGTGLACMDALLSDAFLDPDDSDDYAERVLRLDHGAVVVDLPTDGVLDEAAGRDGGLVFGADAPLSELSVQTVEAWAGVLHGAPDSQLLLLDHNFRAEENTQRLLEMFGNFGLAHRVDVVNEKSMVNFFRTVDVALVPVRSTRPEVVVNALWAGAPVVCLAGEGRTGREPGAVLAALDLGDTCLADDAGDYAAKALAWAGDAARRTEFAQGIRARLRAAPLFDAGARAADLERAYETLWRGA
ncbi:MAG: tetratricopeptide repeat protein [Hyphomicrobiales bacterium]|nr:tetratricopeptide repeat protein [Hyphomicrobiales bacterium]